MQEVVPYFNEDARESLDEVIIDNMSLIPGLSRELILLSVLERRFDHVSAIYDLLITNKNEERRGQLNFQPQAPRKGSITTGVVERQETAPEIQLFLNDAQVYEKVCRTEE